MWGFGRARPAREPAPSPRDVVQQVRRLELRTRRLVDSRFSGEYHSVFKGQGIEFAEVREYQPGDDVRAIDWNVTARLGHPFIKRFVEERELTVLLVVDVSGSQRWGTRGRFKSETVAEVATTLAMSAVRNNDRIGLLLLTDRVERYLPPRKGRRHALRLVRDLLAFQPEGRGTDLAAGLRYAARVLQDRAIVFLFSDFPLSDGWDDFTRALKLIGVRHDVVAAPLVDPRDLDLPDAGLLWMEDPETGERGLVDTSDAAVREEFAARAGQEAEQRRRLFRRLGIDEIRLRTDESYAAALLAFFRRREQRVRR
jgi:uncharacterized protein (DUF58 family)